MIYPVFDKSSMPFTMLPIAMHQDPTLKGQGKKAVVGKRYFDVELLANDGLVSDMQQALYAFWKNDCNYGTTPFLIALPWMGSGIDNNYPNFLVKFTDGLSSQFDNTWTTKQKLIIVGEVNHVGDEITDEEKIITWS